MKPNILPFERLERTTNLIARHADYPGKQAVVADCLDDIEDRWARGLLTLEQRFRLCAILIRGAGLPRDRTHAPGV
jgi:hypothetical protein